MSWSSDKGLSVRLAPRMVRATGWWLAAASSICCLSWFTHPAGAYPQFQTFGEKHSHRVSDCSMCHANSSGPTGNESGQVGGLSAQELERLTKARAAMEPGQDVDSPILNEFGNKIIKTLGRKKFLELISTPEGLAPALGDKSDLDGDGIPDATEYLDGTDPLNKSHGEPLRLFLVNLNRYKVHIALLVVACALLNWGLSGLIRWFSSGAADKEDGDGCASNRPLD